MRQEAGQCGDMAWGLWISSSQPCALHKLHMSGQVVLGTALSIGFITLNLQMRLRDFSKLKQAEHGDSCLESHSGGGSRGKYQEFKASLGCIAQNNNVSYRETIKKAT